MGSPLKPWEVSANGSGPPNDTRPYISNTERLHSAPMPYPESGGGSKYTSGMPSTSAAVLPPIPPRPTQTRPVYSAYNRSSVMSPYSSPYSNYGGGSYTPYGGGMGPYSPYSAYGQGSYGMGMGMGGPYGNNRLMGTPYGNLGMEQSFSQVAEESASSAFQSIESFVSAFSSISAMFDSTFHALYSSFRAVIGVADHLGRLKQILSALAVFRFFKWVFRRMLYLIGISKIKPADIESLWNNLSANDATSDSASLNYLSDGPNKPSSWPILMFLGFIFAGPYLMWKLIKSLKLDPSSKDFNTKWATGEAEHFIATAEYPFEPMQERELSMKHGQTIRLAPSKFQPPDLKGWVLASDGSRIGLVPTNYIKIVGKRSDTSTNSHKSQFSSSFPQEIEMIMPQPQDLLDDKLLMDKTTQNMSLSNLDPMGVSSDDDSETLVGEPLDD